MFNKPLKTRIKKVTTADGEVIHHAQFKYLFRWYNFSDMVTVWSHTTPHYVWLNSSLYDSGSVEMCMGLIDEYIEKFHADTDKRNKEKVVNIEYIKYP